MPGTAAAKPQPSTVAKMALLSSEISTKKLVPLCRQLATSYDAGIPIIQTLDLVKRNVRDREVATVLTHMSDDIRNGSTLAEAATRQEKKLPKFFVNLLATGEAGGRLDITLRDLADYFEDQLELRRDIIRSMTYPTLYLCAAWFLGSFALGIVGRLRALFNERNATFNLGEYFREYAGFQMNAMLVVGAVVLAAGILSRMGVWRWIYSFVGTFIWPLSKVTRRFALARFFRSLSLLIASGTGMIPSIRASAAVTSNPYVEKDLLRSVPYVKEGFTLTESFSHCRMLTPLDREIILVGETSGKLDTQLNKASKYHQDEANHAVAVALKVLNVLIVLAVGLVVGYIVITFWSQYFGIMGDVLDDI